MPPPIRKYPRTHHIEGSRLQPGDHDLDCVPLSQLEGRRLVVEEKMDGANAAISFSPDGDLLLQSRGHYLTGGPRERHFDLFKKWANTYRHQLWQLLGGRFIMYGEWLYAKHTIYYNALPHFFLEFDIYDREANEFLSLGRRTAMLSSTNFIRSVTVLHHGAVPTLSALIAHVGGSRCIDGDHRAQLRQKVDRLQLPVDRALRETMDDNLMEGLYIKTETENAVTGRYKYVRADFLTTVTDSESHWLDRPIIPNDLAPGVDILS